MTDDEIYDRAEDAIRKDGQQVADLVLARARHDPTIALAILGVAVNTVLDTVPNRDERAALLDEWIECLTEPDPPNA